MRAAEQSHPGETVVGARKFAARAVWPVSPTSVEAPGSPAWLPLEPTWGEKIVYYKYIDAYGTAGANCYWTVKTRTYKSPTGSCFFLWKY